MQYPETQKELTTAAGIGRVTRVRIENGQQPPRYDILEATGRGAQAGGG